MSACAVLHIFNPETDFALGDVGDNFMPKANIAALRRRMALLPAVWAGEGDAILILDERTDDSNEMAEKKNLSILTLQELKDREFASVKPWGWNPTLRRLLLQNGINESLLPTIGQLAQLRRLAHRSTTMAFHEIIGTHASMRPIEVKDIAEAMRRAMEHPRAYLKAPWSSSGRGIRRSLPGEEETLRRWLIGTLRRQGSAMVEPDWRQSFDFATEWSIKENRAHFLGYSLFNVDSHCQYRSNSNLSQNEIVDMLVHNGWSHTHLDLQRKALEQLIAPHYSGPLGIDALFSSDYGFNLCVEINLRMTMGIVNLLKNNEIRQI